MNEFLSKIEKYRRKLIDVSKKNPLLSFKFNEKSKTHIRIIDEVPDFVLNKLKQEKELTLEYIKSPNDIPGKELTDEFYELLEKEKQVNQNYIKIIENVNSTNKDKLSVEYELINKVRSTLRFKKINFEESVTIEEQAKRLAINTSFNLPFIYPNKIVPKKYSDNKLQTLMFRDTLNDKLHAIYNKATNILKETGVGSLYIIYGNLKWYENSDKENPIYTPILIQEVDIIRYLKNNEFVYSISAIEDTPELNIVLQQKLKDLQLLLKDYEESQSIDEFLTNLKRIVNEKYPEWEVLNYLTIGIVSSTNLILYDDLDLDKCYLDTDEEQFQLIESVLGYGIHCEEDMEEINHDNLLGTDKLPLLITEADGSQFNAINAVLNKGQNVIIQGPPGTGKSQTICNIITSAINNNKTVLFIAEKLAALKVVKSRLDNMNVGDFCLEIHSNKIKKADIIESLRSRKILKKEKKNSDITSNFNLDQYIELVNRLNLHSELTNSYNSIFKINYFQLIWKFINLSEELKFTNGIGFKIIIKINNFKSLNDIELVEKVLEEYKNLKHKFIKKYSSENDNLWKNFFINKKNQNSEDEIIRLLKNFQVDITSLENKILDGSPYDNNVSNYQIENDKLLIHDILLFNQTNDFNKFLEFNNFGEEYITLNQLISEYERADSDLNSIFINEVYKSESFIAILSRLIIICSNLEAHHLNLKKLNSLSQIIYSFLESRKINSDTKIIEELINYLNFDLSDLNNLNSILTVLRLIDLEALLYKEFLSTKNLNSIDKITIDTISNISNSKFNKIKISEVTSHIQELKLVIDKTEYICEKANNLYKTALHQKNELTLSDIEDIIRISEVLKEYEPKFYLYWHLDTNYSDLQNIKIIQGKISEIKENNEAISNSLNINTLRLQNLDNIKHYIQSYKDGGLFKFFSSNYWKLNRLKKYLSNNKIESIEFVKLLDTYIYNVTSEQILKSDSIFTKIFGNNIDILQIDFDLLNETIIYKDKLKSISYSNNDNSIFLNYIYKSNEYQLNDFINKIFLIKENDSDILKFIKLFNLSSINILKDECQKEIDILNSIQDNFFLYKFYPDLLLIDILKFNDKFEKWIDLNLLYQNDLAFLKQFYLSVNELKKLLSQITNVNKFTLEQLYDCKKLYNNYIVTKEKILNHSINKLIKINFNNLNDSFSIITQANRILNTLNSSHQHLSDFFKNREVNFFELKNKVDIIHKDFLCSLEELEKMYSNKIINIYNQFNSTPSNQITLVHIIEYFRKLIDDIEVYADYVRYHELLSVINKYELNNFLFDISRNDYDENNLEKYFLLFTLSTYIDNFWQKKKYNSDIISENLNLENIFEKFRTEDKQLLASNRKVLKNKLLTRTIFDMKDKYYKQERNKRAGDKVGFDLIDNEVSKQTRYIPIRSLFQKAGEEILFLKPCLMMSPQSVSQFLPKKDFLFDIIVIDEASQIKPEKCLASLLRGKQLVVVGDSKQLPPTFDYRKSLEDEEIINEDNSIQQEDEQIEESILELANGTIKNNYMLTWHYRSKHHSLINFSNSKFYDNKLLIFPSPNLNSDFGISHYYLEDAVYNDSTNLLEAESIVNKVMELLSSNSTDTIGVVAVNQKQSNLIDDLIFKRIGSSPAKEHLFNKATDGEEQLIIKNLENIQGDERDIILISTVYGKDESGKFYQRFGPINSKYGHRRLNVLFTRARKKILLYTSMNPEEIITEGKNLGVKILREYLEYARSGTLQIAEKTNKGVDSDFELSVKQFLEANGFEVDTQIGVRGYFVDLAIKDISSSRYILGIECDGAPYHTELSARERDRLRQEVLEGLGWNIYRILSTNWYSHYENEKDKLLSIINKLAEKD